MSCCRTTVHASGILVNHSLYAYSNKKCSTACSLPLFPSYRVLQSAKHVQVLPVVFGAVPMISKVFFTLVIAIVLLSGTDAATTDCQSVLGSICQLNGAGSHCHPCLPKSYVACSNTGEAVIKTCAQGETV